MRPYLCVTNEKELSNNVKDGVFLYFAGIRSNSNIKNKLKQLMSNSKISAAAFADTKPHYDLLDGLRGVAALMVIFYHVFEAFATSPIDQRFNHGYLAVDFFLFYRDS